MSRISSGLGDRVPYMVGQGNHERDWPGTGTTCGGECTTSMDSGGCREQVWCRGGGYARNTGVMAFVPNPTPRRVMHSVSFAR